MVTQSGGFGFGVIAMAAYYGVGCNYAISSGNEADLNLLDWVADLVERPEVEIIVAFMEAIDDGRRLIEIGERALELGKPIPRGNWQHRGGQPGGDFPFRADDIGLWTLPGCVQAEWRRRDSRSGRAGRHRQGVSSASPGRQSCGVLTPSGGAGVPSRTAASSTASHCRRCLKPRRRTCARHWFRSRRPTTRWMSPRTPIKTTTPPTARPSVWCSPIPTSTRWWRAHRGVGQPSHGPRTWSRCCGTSTSPSSSTGRARRRQRRCSGLSRGQRCALHP